jgi:protein involved in polysaccharide export with SLBB domain
VPLRTVFTLWILVIAPSGAAAQSLPSPGSGETPVVTDPGEGVRPAGPGEGLEGAVSGLDYTLGPGDRLVIGIWAPQPTVYEVGVTLEGEILIPTVGTLNVNGIPLAEAKERIGALILESFRDVDVTVTLTALRRFQIHVLGRVNQPGTYLATAVDRVSAALAWAGGFSPDANQRRVLLLAGGEIRAEADMILFQGRGESGSNPLLRDGDVIYVPYTGRIFELLGAFHANGRYPYRTGDHFSDALLVGGGLHPEAVLDTVEVARYLEGRSAAFRFFAVAGDGLAAADPGEAYLLPPETGRVRPADLELEVVESIEYPDFALLPDDQIFIRSVPRSRRTRLVEVLGEIAYPGRYAIIDGKTRVSDVVAMAGGLTPDAFLNEARLIRTEAIRQEDPEFERLKKIPPGDMDEDEYAYFKVKSRENPGQMVVHFHELFAEGKTSEDLLVKRGDRIEIPSTRDFVSVIGLVQFPGNVLYVPGLEAGDYVNRAGGFAEDANRGRARVIRATGGEWVPMGDAGELKRGDTVWVPEKEEGNFWGTFKDVITVTTQILTIYLIADRALE